MKNPPEVLYDGQYFSLPNLLIEKYSKLLQKYDLYQESVEEFPDESITGGKSREETLKHFTHMFFVSSLRSQYLVLDPDKYMGKASKFLLNRLQDGKVSLLDVPCGTGASIGGLLANIYELQQRRYRPKTPMNLSIYAADISPHALEIYEEFMEQIQVCLNKVAISLEFETQTWDGTDSFQTAELIDEWRKFNQKPEEYIVFMANFSHGKPSFIEDIKRSLEHIQESFHGQDLRFYWIEPYMSGTESFFERVAKLFKNLFQPLMDTIFSPEDFETRDARYKWIHPFKDKKPNGSVSLFNLNKVLNKDD